MKTKPFVFTTFLLLLFVNTLASIITLSNQQQNQKFDIILVGTNDIHGAAYPTVLSRKDTGQKYFYGGLAYMARIIEILKNQSNRNLLYLDAGDQFQGGLESSKTISSGQIISDYFNHMKTNAGAIGNHQFDYGPQFLKNYLQKINHSILSANLINTNKQEKIELPLTKQERSKIYSFDIKDKFQGLDQNFTQIKVGVIGLSTVQTPYITSGFIQKLFPNTYKFLQYKAIVLQEAAKLKEQGAHAIVIVSHAGNDCTKNSDYGIWTIKNQQKIPCKMDDQIFKLLDQLPDGLIDVVVQGHRHTQSHYFYKGIPIIGTIDGGFYLHAIRLRFTLQKNTAYILDEDLVIEGPIPVCQRIFNGTNKCEYVSPQKLQVAGELREWQFHGQKVYADEELAALYKQKYAQKMKVYQYEIVSNYISFPLGKNYSANSPIGSLFTNVLANSILRRNDLEFDFLIINNGAFRTTWYTGVIRYAEFNAMFPFSSNELYSFKISGKDLKRMIQIIQNGAKKYYATWGLQQKLKKNPQKFIELAKQNNQNISSSQLQKQSQNYYFLEQLRLTVTNATIEDDQIYSGVTLGFLINGGDDFSKVVSKAEEIKILDKQMYGLQSKELIMGQLQKIKQLTEEDLIGPNKMESIIFEQEKIEQKQTKV